LSPSFWARVRSRPRWRQAIRQGVNAARNDDGRALKAIATANGCGTPEILAQPGAIAPSVLDLVIRLLVSS